MIDVDGVLDVHDLHAWTITSGLPVLSAHVVVSERVLSDGHGGIVLDRLGNCLSRHFDVEHSTFQLEAAQHRAHEESPTTEAHWGDGHADSEPLAVRYE